MAMNSLQFNRVARAIRVKPQEEMLYKRFAIIVSLYIILLFVELKEKNKIGKEFGFDINVEKIATC